MLDRLRVTVEAQVRSQASHCGICGRQSGTGIVAVRILRSFSCQCHPTIVPHTFIHLSSILYRGTDKSLVRPGRKQARKHVRDARDFNNIETRAVIKFFFPLQGKAPKEIHAILTETLACFLPGRAKDLSAPLYCLSN